MGAFMNDRLMSALPSGESSQLKHAKRHINSMRKLQFGTSFQCKIPIRFISQIIHTYLAFAQNFSIIFFHCWVACLVAFDRIALRSFCQEKAKPLAFYIALPEGHLWLRNAGYFAGSVLYWISWPRCMDLKQRRVQRQTVNDIASFQ